MLLQPFEQQVRIHFTGYNRRANSSELARYVFPPFVDGRDFVERETCEGVFASLFDERGCGVTGHEAPL